MVEHLEGTGGKMSSSEGERQGERGRRERETYSQAMLRMKFEYDGGDE